MMIRIHRVTLVLRNGEHWHLEVPKDLNDMELYKCIEEQYYND